ncbi:MAG: hypothetical protein K2H38_07180 [Muribaculaceae bacterium]|nr:hypothetical protein [Muribaculaceae bacterium]
MKKLHFLFILFVVVILGSCKATGSSSNIEFEILEGKIEKPVSFADADVQYDSISVDYKIAWPVRGDEKVTGLIKGWIIEQLSGDRNVDSSNIDIMEILDSMADKLASSDGAVNQIIEVIAEEDTPFESYLTVNFDDETSFWMAHYSDYKSASLSIRLTDGKVFNPDNAIANTDKMRGLIQANLQKQFEYSEWFEVIGDYNRNGIPMPKQPIKLTKEGILVNYLPAEISYHAAGGFSCIVPYDELMYALSDDAMEFLSKPQEKNLEKKILLKDGMELTESEAIELIKKANIRAAGSLSSDFQAACDKDEFYGDAPFLKYWFYPDAGEVINPDIRILRMFEDSERGKVTVIFDFIEASATHMGWVNRQSDERDKIVAMDFIRENDKWVVDNFYEEMHTSLDDFIKILKSGESGGEKANFNRTE